MRLDTLASRMLDKRNAEQHSHIIFSGTPVVKPTLRVAAVGRLPVMNAPALMLDMLQARHEEVKNEIL